MKIIFHTVDLCHGREYLMPWRTALEVTNAMIRYGHDAVIFNSCHDQSDIDNYSWQCVNINSYGMNVDQVINDVNNYNPDVFIYAMTFRDGLKKSSLLEHIECKKVVYMSGGVYDLKSALYLGQNYGWKLAKPFLIESLLPKSLLSRTLKSLNIDSVIGLNDFTSQIVKKAGFSSSYTIYPGKDDFEQITPDNSIIEKYGLMCKKWILFTGAPALYRGADMLVKAVDNSSEDSIRLVMLMRTDVGSVYEKFNQTFACMKHPERVLIIKEKLNRMQLRAFFGAAWYAVLPFIVIPSEIPLTYFELMSCGTPVVTFENGGTSRYLKEGLVIADKSVKELQKTLETAWNDEEMRKSKSEKALNIMANHPTWEQVGKEWLKLLD